MFTFTRFGHKALASWTEDTYEDISELAKFPIPLCVSHDSSLRGGSSGHTQLGELGPVTSQLHPIFLMDAKCRSASLYLTLIWSLSSKRGLPIEPTCLA